MQIVIRSPFNFRGQYWLAGEPVVDDETGQAMVDAGFATFKVSQTIPKNQIDIFNLNGLLSFKYKLNNAKNQLIKIIVTGDSTVAGIGSDGLNGSITDVVSDAFSFPAQLRYKYAKKLGTTEQGLIKASDSRNSTTGGPTVGATSGSIGNNGGGVLGLNNTRSVTIVTPFPCTDIDLIYYEGSGLGGITSGAWQYTVDGGAAVPVANAGGNTTKIITLTGLANTTHTIVVSGTSATNALFSGLYYYNNTTKGVLVTNQGRSSIAVSDLVGQGSIINTDANGQDRLINANLTIPSPDLVILYVGINDAATQQPITTFKNNLQRIINAITSVGGSILIVSQAESPTKYTPLNQADYIQAQKDIALSNLNTTYISIQEQWGPYTNAAQYGLYTAASNTTIHHSQIGYASVADIIFKTLESL